MTATRRRNYFDVPQDQQPLRVRPRKPRPEPRIEPKANPLEQLVVGHLFHPLDDGAPLIEADRAELLDAAHECEHGRLPGDRTPPCGCWGELPPVPDVIPDWVLADARQLLDHGYTLRKVATALLPVTGCQDIPGCEKALSYRLAERPAARSRFDKISNPR